MLRIDQPSDGGTATFISPSGHSNNHIKAINIANGEAGDFQQSDILTLRATDRGGVEMTTYPHLHGEQSLTRRRGELAMQLVMESEGGEATEGEGPEQWLLNIYHRKGMIFANAERVLDRTLPLKQRIEQFLIDAGPNAIFTFSEVAKALNSQCRAVGKCMASLWDDGKRDLCTQVRFKDPNADNPWIKEYEDTLPPKPAADDLMDKIHDVLDPDMLQDIIKDLADEPLEKYAITMKCLLNLVEEDLELVRHDDALSEKVSPILMALQDCLKRAAADIFVHCHINLLD